MNNRWRHSLALALTAWLCVVTGALALSGANPDADHHPQVLTIGTPAKKLCTAVKIGDQSLLTAAHCVVDERSGELASAFQSGGVISLDNSPQQLARANAITATVEQTLLPDAYQQGLKKLAVYRRQRLADLSRELSSLPARMRDQFLRMRHHFAERYPDIAVIRLQTATPEIPIVTVDFNPLKAGAKVEIVGFGCTASQPVGHGSLTKRQSGWTSIIRVDSINFYTEATQRSVNAPSLCSGDSGGPVLYNGRVVGINSVVYGLHRHHGARSNMAVNLSALADWAAWP